MAEGSDRRKHTSRFRRDFLGKLEILRVRLRVQLEYLNQKRRVPETAEQLHWALQQLDKIQLHYERKMPWPAGALDWVVRGSWPAESLFREDLARLEKDYYAQITKPQS